jgi:8-amino-7-oxononanoate synthase
MGKNSDQVKKLQALIAFFNLKTKELNITSESGHSAIHIVRVPGNETARTAANAMQEKGFDVRPILSPTVPKGKECLRICLHTFNTEAQITDLLQTLKTVL